MQGCDTTRPSASGIAVTGGPPAAILEDANDSSLRTTNIMNSPQAFSALSSSDTIPSSPLTPLSPGLSPTYDRTADTFDYSPTQFRYIKLELVKLRNELFPKGHFFGDKRPLSVQEQYKQPNV